MEQFFFFAERLQLGSGLLLPFELELHLESDPPPLELAQLANRMARGIRLVPRNFPQRFDSILSFGCVDRKSVKIERLGYCRKLEFGCDNWVGVTARMWPGVV